MPEGSVASTLVLGLGNPLRGDDGIGVRVVEALIANPLPVGVEVIDGGTQGLGVVPLLEGRERLIVVDAANLGQEPGAHKRFALNEVRFLGTDTQIVIHEAGLREALLLAEALGFLPQDTVFYGIQPGSLEWEEGLSAPVQVAVQQVTGRILAELYKSKPLDK